MLKRHYSAICLFLIKWKETDQASFILVADYTACMSVDSVVLIFFPDRWETGCAWTVNANEQHSAQKK